MREILFKGKRKDDKEWIYGDFVGYDMICNSLEDTTDATGEYYGQTPYVGFVDVVRETICEYTGLNDRNKKKIFEGDIVQLTDVRYNNEWKAVVVFGNPYSQYSWGWNLQYIGEKPQINTDILLWVEMEDVGVYCEIIGNIHDNPELLRTHQNDEVRE